MVDAQLPLGLCGWLRDRGHDAEHVASIGLAAASDHAIASRAQARDAILISKDADFLFLRLPDRFAFLWLRCGNMRNATLTRWPSGRWHEVEALLSAGERLIEVP